MRRFWAKKCRRDHLQSLWWSVVLVKVCRWQLSAAAEGRWGSLTKCGVTKLVTVRRVYDGPSCRFVMKFREVIQYPYSKSWSVLERRPSTDHCAYDGPSYLWQSVGGSVVQLPKKDGEVWPSYGYEVHDGPSCKFVMKFREVIQYPYSKSWSVLERRPMTDRYAYDSPSYLASRVMKRVAEKIA